MTNLAASMGALSITRRRSRPNDRGSRWSCTATEATGFDHPGCREQPSTKGKRDEGLHCRRQEQSLLLPLLGYRSHDNPSARCSVQRWPRHRQEHPRGGLRRLRKRRRHPCAVGEGDCPVPRGQCPRPVKLERIHADDARGRKSGAGAVSPCWDST